MSEQKAFDLVVADLDGTLLSSTHQLSEKNEAAIKAAVAAGVPVVFATGKTRYSAQGLIERLALTTPGIYVQGVLIHDSQGQVIYDQRLDPALCRQIITFAEDRGFEIMVYSGSKILVRKASSRVIELTSQYGEPAPESIGALQNIVDELPINKIIVVRSGEPRKVTALRWQLGKQLDGRGRMTQAMIPDMLEILPPNGGKGTALKALLKQMGIAAERVLAIGDGENDIEMIQLAGLGVAVGNADEKLKAAANEIVGTNDENGFAEAIEKFVLKKPISEPAAAAPANPEAAVSPEKTTDQADTTAEETDNS